ncbi:MAG: hypothetical protein HQL32_02675 [Planctomycetes bacterium]|nr:hypothetical protein [Planctomycetota bacterium]
MNRLHLFLILFLLFCQFDVEAGLRDEFYISHDNIIAVVFPFFGKDHIEGVKKFIKLESTMNAIGRNNILVNKVTYDNNIWIVSCSSIIHRRLHQFTVTVYGKGAKSSGAIIYPKIPTELLENMSRLDVSRSTK